MDDSLLNSGGLGPTAKETLQITGDKLRLTLE